MDVLITGSTGMVGKSILDEPSKLTPAIVRDVANIVAVAAFPDVF